jgi:flagellar biosynthesis/type III secretory pathway protein FliH
LNIGEEKLSALLNDAISRFTDSGKYIIRLHPDSCAELSQNEETIREQLDEKIALIFRPDPSLKPCECLIESDYGVIDARIEEQLDEFGKLLHGVSQ